MAEVQMTQIGINNYMLYTKSGKIELCKICQTYSNSIFVDIICMEDNQIVENVYSSCLKPIVATKEIIEAFGFSIIKRQNEPKIYGHPANEVFDLVYNNKASWMAVLIYDLYYLLLYDTKTYSKTDFPLCVHHLQNLITSDGGDVENEIPLISILKDKMLYKSR